MDSNQDDLDPFQIPDDEALRPVDQHHQPHTNHNDTVPPPHPSSVDQVFQPSQGASDHLYSETDHEVRASTSSVSQAKMEVAPLSPFSSASSSSHGQNPESALNPSSSPSIQTRATIAQPPSEILIIDAQKTGDSASSYIVYVIQNGTIEAKRRYSEFEAFREALVKLHPTLAVAPIPQKHSFSDYAAKQGKAKEDLAIISRRKRLLQKFLRRCHNHPQLRDDELLLKFLDGRYTWAEIANSPPLLHLPKSNLRAPVQNPADPHASPAYNALPLPSSVSSLRQPNQRFLDSEAFTNRFANHMSGSMEKVNRRLFRRWTEASTDYAELGAILNGFSLTESGQLATAVERTGQAADSAYIATGQLLKEWEEKITEPFHEYTQFAAILQKLLKWRQLKHLQYEMAQDALEAKKAQLEELERVEKESKRLQEALERGGAGLLNSSGRVTGSGVDGNGIRDGLGSGFRPNSLYGSAIEENEPSSSSGAESRNSKTATLSNTASATGDGQTVDDSAENSIPKSTSSSSSSAWPSPPPKRQSTTPRSSGYGLLGALTHTFHSVMDVDRDATRRNNIGKLREEIGMLEEGVSLTANDLHFATAAIQADLDRFQRQKVADFKDMMIEFAKSHRELCRVNLENWKEAKAEIDRMQRPANMPESSLVRKQREDGGGRRA